LERVEEVERVERVERHNSLEGDRVLTKWPCRFRPCVIPAEAGIQNLISY